MRVPFSQSWRGTTPSGRGVLPRLGGVYPALLEAVGHVGELGDVSGPVEVVREVAVVRAQAGGAVVLLAEDVGVARMAGDVGDDVDDDPLKRHAVALGWPPRDS